MKNEAPKRADLDPGGGWHPAGAIWGGTLTRVVKHTFSQKVSILRGSGTQMARASVYEPLKDRL